MKDGTHELGGTETDQQAVCLATATEMPQATIARVLSRVLANNRSWLTVIAASIGVHFAFAGDTPHPDIVTAPDDDPEFLSLVDDLYGRKRVKWGSRYRDLSDEQVWDAAKQAARQCLALAALGRFPAGACGTMPLFSPGIDVKSAAAHDFSAIVRGYPAQLNYEARVNNSWYVYTAPTADWTNPCYGGNYTGQHCDEYPYNASKQGGKDKKPSLQLIDNVENPLEGNQYQGFLNVCGVRDGRDFLVVPTVMDPTAKVGVPSVGWCPGPVPVAGQGG